MAHHTNHFRSARLHSGTRPCINPRACRRTLLAMAAGLAVNTAALAQAGSTGPTTNSTTSTVTVTGRTDAPLGVGGFPEPLARSPLQASVFNGSTLRDNGIDGLAGITQLDAGISDAYNSEGYWGQLSVRGYVLDPRANYRRDGLPINAETALSLANKDRVEVLKGISGMQAGTSAPGGLVNLVVKRPVAGLRDISLGWTESNTVHAAADLSERFGADGRFGVRVNAEAARLRPQTQAADGRRHLLAVALDWQVSADGRLDFELERSRRSQPSVPGFSLLGDRLPDASRVNPRTSLNNQPWSLPVVLGGDTASLRWQQRLNRDWSFSMHGASQQLRSDDRVAFPYGCTAADGTYYADRYCPDGSFDLYDFRSEGERRRTDALDVHVDGNLQLGGTLHRVSVGAQASRVRDRFNRQAYNYVGSGLIDGSVTTPADPALTDENTQRDEHNRELYLRDVVRLGDQWQLWGGLRHTRVHRQSVRTDGSRAIDYSQSFTVPWLAVALTPAPGTLLYASWGEGVESEVVPNRSKYRNRGQVLPSLKSRQWEVGAKLSNSQHEAGITLFDIDRPVANDFCDAAGVCDRRLDGSARHRGLEAQAAWRQGPLTLRGSAMFLQARRNGSAAAGINGLRPTNVPDRSLKAQASYQLTPAWLLQAQLVHEGRRAALPDNSIELPSWTTAGAALQWQARVAGQALQVRMAVDNLTDRRAWRESPYQFSHSYLFPLAPRTFKILFSTSFQG